MMSKLNKIIIIVSMIIILFTILVIIYVENNVSTSETFYEEDIPNISNQEDYENPVEEDISQKDKTFEDIYNIDECTEEFMNNYFEEISNIKEDDEENILIVTTLDKIENDYGARKIIPSPNNQYVLLYENKEEKDIALKQLEKDSSIISVDENNVMTLDVSKYNSWGIKKMGLDGSMKVANNLNLPEVRVAVIDSGCDVNLINKYYSGKIAEIYDLFTNSKKTITDTHGHGTHIIGTISEGTPDNVKIVPIKIGTGDRIYTDKTLAAINYIVYYEKADVINMSFGGTGYSSSLYNAIESANRKNIISVCAAGNESTSQPHYPSGYNNTVSIGSVDSGLNLAPYSNYGDTIDFVAPGSNIKSTLSNDMELSKRRDGEDDFEVLSGTSMATPHAVNAIAILKSYNKNLSRSNVINLLKTYAIKDLGYVGKDIYYGNGFILFDSSLLRDTDSTDGCEEFGVFKKKTTTPTTDEDNKTISLTDSITLKVGETYRLVPVIKPNNNTETKVTWKSSDSNIASVSSKGLVSAKKIGTATITAKLENGKKATCKVTVEKKKSDDVPKTPTLPTPTPTPIQSTKLLKVKDTNITAIYKNVIIVPYGKEITIQVNDNTKVTSENSSVARIKGNKIQVIGTGYFVITAKKDNAEEKTTFFAWNAYLRKGKYKAYTKSSRKVKVGTIKAKAYFAVSKTKNSKSLKINDCILTNNCKRKREKVLGKYIRSYYNTKKDKSSTSNWKYSFSTDFSVNQGITTTINSDIITINNPFIRAIINSKIDTSTTNIFYY